MTDRYGLTFPLEGVPLLEHREVLQEAERLGYTDAWTLEVDGTDAFIPLALASTWTKELRLGCAIANVFTRGPALLAMEAAAISEAAPGRFCLGLGTSSPAIVERWNGVPLHRPLARMRETMDFLRQAFAGEKVSIKGDSVRASGFRLSRRPASPPIYVAALRERMLALAGSAADGVIINWLSPNDVSKVVPVAKEAAKAAGKDPEALDIVCRIFVVVAADEETARGMARLMITGYLTTPMYSAFHRWLGRGDALRPMAEAWKAGDRRSAASLVPDEVIDDILVIGDRQRIQDKIEAYRRNGVTTPLIHLVPAAMNPADRAALSLAAFKELTAP
ncbi:MAG: LLM class F420-dependent oxidoreductase [Dehalococcoidia bacterium]